MATYSFIVRKGKIQITLTTTDKELLTAQFEQWVREAGEYAKQKKAREHKDIVNTQIKAEEEITKRNIETQIRKSQPKEQKEETKSSEPAKTDEPKNDLDIFYAPPTPATRPLCTA